MAGQLRAAGDTLEGEGAAVGQRDNVGAVLLCAVVEDVVDVLSREALERECIGRAGPEVANRDLGAIGLAGGDEEFVRANAAVERVGPEAGDQRIVARAADTRAAVGSRRLLAIWSSTREARAQLQAKMPTAASRPSLRALS